MTSDSNWPPSASSVLRSVVGGVCVVVLSVGTWLLMDWAEGRVLLAQTVERVDTVAAESAATTAAVRELDEHDHKVDLAIQRLTDLLAVHDEMLHRERDRR